MYQIQVQVKTLTVTEWLREYCHPEIYVPLCAECPEYGRNWSCPPGTPKPESIVGDYRYVQVIGLKVLYDEEVRRAAERNPEQTERLRALTYGIAKKNMLQALLALEEVFPESLTIMAGRCELCKKCARLEGKACRHPEKMRYSFSGLGFDLGGLSEKLLKIPLLWQNEGLPEYNVAIAAFLHQ